MVEVKRAWQTQLRVVFRMPDKRYRVSVEPVDLCNLFRAIDFNVAKGDTFLYASPLEADPWAWHASRIGAPMLPGDSFHTIPGDSFTAL